MPSRPRKHRFSAERRRALELLVHIHGLKRHVLAGLVRRELVAAERVVAMAGGKGVEVVRGS